MTLEWIWILTKFLIFLSLIQTAGEYMLLAKENMKRQFLGAGYLLSALIMISPVSETLSFIPLLIVITNTLYWRRPFNGGSDSMLFILLFAVFIHDTLLGLKSFTDFSVNVFIAAVCSLSYFVAGATKLQNGQWKNGNLILWSQQLSCYKQDSLSTFSSQRAWPRLITILQLMFPVAFLHPHMALLFIFLMSCFHLAVFKIYGLNRFFLTWAACYPSMYYVSQKISGL